MLSIFTYIIPVLMFILFLFFYLRPLGFNDGGDFEEVIEPKTVTSRSNANKNVPTTINVILDTSRGRSEWSSWQGGPRF
jgi:uncharacterized protein YacL